MRILMLSWEYPPHVVGGLGAHVAALVPALARRGVEVTLLTPRWKGGERLATVEGNALIRRVDPPVARIGNFYADVQQTNLNLEEVGHALWSQDGVGQGKPDFDLIHAHDWLVAFSAASLKRLHKVPLVATMHATERGRGRGNLSGDMAEAINGAEWWLAYEAWRVITASHFMAEEVKSYFQLPDDKIDVVPNGVDTLRFDQLEALDLSEFRAEWALPDERIVFFVGRVQHEKGTHLLIEAAPRVLARVPKVKFIIAGTGGLLERLRQRTAELGINDRVLLPGFISDGSRDRLFKVADAAVFPSLYEPFGIVALEAMAARCPVVASREGGLKEVVTDGETGIMVHPDSVESLAAGILEVLENREAAEARCIRAYQAVKEEYSWDRIANMTVEVYEAVLRERAQTIWL